MNVSVVIDYVIGIIAVVVVDDFVLGVVNFDVLLLCSLFFAVPVRKENRKSPSRRGQRFVERGWDEWRCLW